MSLQTDLDLSLLLFKIRAEAGELNYLSREKKFGKLFETLNKIHDDSRKAMWRFNELTDKQEQGDKPAAS